MEMKIFENYQINPNLIDMSKKTPTLAELDVALFFCIFDLELPRLILIRIFLVKFVSKIHSNFDFTQRCLNEIG